MKVKLICQTENISLRDELSQQVSRRYYKNLKSKNTIFWVNQKETKLYEMIKRGDCIEFDYSQDKENAWELYPSQLDIVFEDEYYLIVNKRQGLLSIPTKSEPYSLYQEVLYYLKNKESDAGVSILNRLDKDTKGLVVIAKSRLAAYYLQPTHEKMIRKYKCLCHGIFKQDSGTIINFIDQKEDCHRRFVSSISGKKAISTYRVLNRYTSSTLVEFVLQTGRTHQIRLHTQCLGYPIIGDTMYGIDEEKDLHLCSYYISFTHPFTNRHIEFDIESGWENGRTK